MPKLEFLTLFNQQIINTTFVSVSPTISGKNVKAGDEEEKHQKQIKNIQTNKQKRPRRHAKQNVNSGITITRKQHLLSNKKQETKKADTMCPVFKPFS